MCDTCGLTTFCLIHGQWHDGSCWDQLSQCLQTRGHRSVAPDLPIDDPDADYEARACPAIEALAGAEAPVVVVGHSNASAESALVAARVKPALLVHLCPRFGMFSPPPDAPTVFREGFPFPPRDDAGRSIWDTEAAIDTMYPRLAPTIARRLAERLRPGAPAVGEYPLDQHPDIPTSLIYATDDEFFTPEWGRYVAREMLGIEPIEISGGHFPMAEAPDALADLLDRLASQVAHS